MDLGARCLCPSQRSLRWGRRGQKETSFFKRFPDCAKLEGRGRFVVVAGDGAAGEDVSVGKRARVRRAVNEEDFVSGVYQE